MSKNLPEPQASEEVDLGQLFKLIGNAFQKVFDFFADIFKGIYRVILLILIHFYRRFKWYVGVAIIGVVLGFVLDKSSEKLYGANMFIDTNFSSSRQVYENIRNLHELASVDKDSIKLAEILGIPVKLASKLKGFYIKPDADNNEKVELYSEFYEQLDSVSQTEMKFKDYIKALDSRSFKRHQIGIASTDKTIYSKLDGFVNAISKNKYLNDLLKVSHENLRSEDKTLEEQEKKIDTLVEQYLKIRIKESNKLAVASSSTNLYMANAEQNTLLIDEAKLIEGKLVLAEERRRVKRDLIEQQDIISIISNFPVTGYEITEWYEKMKFVIPTLLLSLTLLVFTGLGLGKYLEQQDKQLNKN